MGRPLINRRVRPCGFLRGLRRNRRPASASGHQVPLTPRLLQVNPITTPVVARSHGWARVAGRSARARRRRWAAVRGHWPEGRRPGWRGPGGSSSTSTVSPSPFAPRTRLGTGSRVPSFLSRQTLVSQLWPSTRARTGVRPQPSVTGGAWLFGTVAKVQPPGPGYLKSFVLKGTRQHGTCGGHGVHQPASGQPA
jgi:hypothetical protein